MTMETSSGLSAHLSGLTTTRNPTWKERLVLWNVAGYIPSREQMIAHLSPAKYKIIAGGERAGKSYSAAMELIARHHLGDLFWLVGPDYKLTRPEFRYLMDFFGKIGAIEQVSFPVSEFQPCFLRLKGGTEIQTVTGRDAQKLAGRAPNGILGCEGAQLDYEIFLKCFGRLAETDGWLWFSGTFEHDSYLSWYSDQFEKWTVSNDENGAAFSIPTWANLAIFPGGMENPKILELREKSPTEEWFLERFGGVPCPPPTAVFKEFRIKTHVTKDADFSEYETDGTGAPLKRNGEPIRKKVELAIDPGYNGAYSVLAIQTDGPFINVVDEVYRQYTDAEMIIDECRSRPWWPNVSRTGVIDIAGTQHHGLASHVEVWHNLAGISLESVRVDIPPGIARMRDFLKDRKDIGPRLRYSPSCKNTIREFALYQYRGVEEGRNTSEKPIDAYNHSAKAMAYWLVARYGFSEGYRTQKRAIKYGHKSRQKFEVSLGRKRPSPEGSRRKRTL